MSVRVAAPGVFTTIQDLGRLGWGSSGVPPSGAMDALAMRAANLLAGNDEEAAGIEFTMQGPSLVFDDGGVCALAGAPFDARIGDDPVPARRSFAVAAGTTLTIGGTRDGVRGYLAVRGGIAIQPVLGSRSTLAPAGFGGIEGRALIAGDVLPIGPSAGPDRPRVLRDGSVPKRSREATLRVIRGPQEEVFAPGALDALLSSAYRVSPRSDRAGVRLDGALLALVGPADIDPEGVVTGAIQVPADGQPIVLGPDRPATGGYAKIAAVVTADLSLLAQARPGDTLRFAEVSVQDARAAWRERLRALRQGVEEL